jgi:hypothetical protein
MGVLLDIGKISTDSVALATLQGSLATAQATVTTLQAQIADAGGTVTDDDTQLSTDLQALPNPVYVINTNSTASFFAYSAAPPGYTIVNADPAT